VEEVVLLPLQLQQEMQERVVLVEVVLVLLVKVVQEQLILGEVEEVLKEIHHLMVEQVVKEL
jgi:hypothetical protein